METKKLTRCILGSLLCSFFICGPLPAQDESAQAEKDLSGLETDRASEQLIKNYLVVTGGRQKHQAISNIVAEGTIKESTLIRNFKLVETRDGKRHLTYSWRHLGRDHKVIYVFDGLETWTQVLGPKEQPPEDYAGIDGQHFANVQWLFQPFLLPKRAELTFRYKSTFKVAGRPVHVVRGYKKKGVPYWFYFDVDKSLLLRWGSKGSIAGVEENMDYRATRFRSVDGVILPSTIELLAEEAAYGRIEFQSIETNQNLSEFSFLRPASKIPTLRQRPIVVD